MTTHSEVTADRPPLNGAQRKWLSEISKLIGGGGIDFGVAAKAQAAPGGAGAPVPGGSGAPAPDACVTPDATTASDYFFDFNSPDLTASDKTYLEAYAKAYLSQNIAEKIEVTGYASTEGDKRTNDTLSQKRADNVARYLVGAKVPKDKVKKPTGMGATTKFSDSNLCLNRRVTITPVLELKVSDFVDVGGTENVPTGKKPDDSLGQKAPEPDITNIKIPEPCPTVSRDVVEDALTDWLAKLGEAQKANSKDRDMKDVVMSTYRVYMAEQTLLGKMGDDGDTREGAFGQRCGREELEQEGITPPKGDGRTHESAVLANEVTKNFPKRISRQNLDNFLKMRPVEAAEELSVKDQIRAKADSSANQILSDVGVPKKYWGKIKEYVKNKIPDGIEKLDIDENMKKLLTKGYKELANIKDDEK